MGLSRDVLMISTADWDTPFWTNKQHVASGLAARGFRVLYVESLGLRRPSATGRDVRRMARRLVRGLLPAARVRRGVWVHSPVVAPFHGSAFWSRLNARWLAMDLGLLVRALRFRRPIVWTYNPAVLGAIAALPRSLLVYHCVDNLAAAPGLPSAAVEAEERSLLRAADVVFATSRPLREHCAALSRRPCHYMPNVADYDHFARARRPGPLPADLLEIPPPRVGFVGAISPYKVDFDLMARCADLRPDWHWVLIGPVGEGQPGTDARAPARPNVHLLGPRDYRVLPDYLRGFDAAVLPCPKNEYTRAMFPMKFFEYLAAGRPVVATALEALEEFRDACVVADGPEAFVAAIHEVLAGRRPDPGLCDVLARAHTWERRLDRMLAVLEAVAGGDASGE